MTATLVLLLIATLVALVGWKDGEARRLAASRDDWRTDCMAARAQRDSQRAECRRLRHRLAVTGIDPHQHRPGRAGWPDPLPGDLRWDRPAPRRRLDPADPQVHTVPATRWAPVPDPLAWVWEGWSADDDTAPDPDPDGALIGGRFTLERAA